MIFSLALLLPLSFAALISEYAGVLAVFLEGLVNLSSFLFFFFSIVFGNLYVAFAFTFLCSGIFVFASSFCVAKLKLNPFIAGLGINLVISGVISLLSESVFGTKSLVTEVVTGTSIFTSSVIKSGLFFWIFAVLLCLVLFLKFTKAGRILKVSGREKDVLFSCGIKQENFWIFSWVAASVLACFSGILCTLKFAAFVPNVCAGRGWIALALVFIGKKSSFGVILATIFYAMLEYGINNVSVIFGGIFANINSTVLLAVPYFVILVMLFFVRGSTVFRASKQRGVEEVSERVFETLYSPLY